MKKLLFALILISFPAYAADEVKVMEFTSPSFFSGQLAPIHGRLVTTQELDITVNSATTNADTDYVSIHCTVDCWIGIGPAPSVSSGGSTSIFQAGGTTEEYPVVGGTDIIDTAADS